MNFGATAYISEDRIFVDHTLFRVLSLGEGSVLHGILLPHEESKEGSQTEFQKFSDKNSEQEYDLFFTPIPHKLWPFIVRMTIHLRHISGAMLSVANYFSEQQIDILMAVCTRSGRQRATWNIAVDFSRYKFFRQKYPKLKDDLTIPIKDKELTKLCKKMQLSVEQLKKDLVRYCGDKLFHMKMQSADQENDDALLLIDPIQAFHVRTLAYRYKKLMNTMDNPDPEIKMLGNTFQASLFEGALCFDDKNFQRILKQVGLKDCLPTRGFVEADTQNLSIRVVVIPKKMLEMYANIQISYRSVPPEDSSTLGLLSKICNCINIANDEANLWRVYNQTHVKANEYEEGKLEFYAQFSESVEHIDLRSFKPSLLEDSEYNLSRLSVENIDLRSFKSSLLEDLEYNLFQLSKPAKRILDVMIRPLTAYNIFISLPITDLLSHSLLNYCWDVGARLGLPKSAFKAITHSEERVTDEVCKTIKICEAMLQFYVGPPSSFIWLEAEYLVAKSHNIPCLRLVESQHADKITIAKDDHAVIWGSWQNSDAIKTQIKTSLALLLSKIKKQKTKL